MYLIFCLAIAGIIVIFFFYNKTALVDKPKYIAVDHKVEKVIIEYVDEIISDYCNEYLTNYLTVRYNLTEFQSETSYVFKTKGIGSLANILDFTQVSFGVRYLEELVVKKYNVNIPVDDQLSFITYISRIEGKIKAVDSVKYLLPEKDYNRLISELKDDIVYYKNKYSTNL